MNDIIKRFQKNSFVKSILVIIILLLAIFILTPRFWEPSVESWKQWAAARILRDTGGFPVFSLGPLYIIYLQLFSIFEYPFSIHLEHIITHLFASLAIFFLLQKFMRKKYALLLTIAWIPHLAIVESGGAVAGIGFLSLYLAPGISRLRNKGFFPPVLLAAALCHTVYIPFLGGHIIGTLIKKWKNRKNHLTIIARTEKLKITPLIITTGLLGLFFLTIIFPSTHMDNNHLVIDPTYSPVSFKNPVIVTFFNVGNDRYVKSTFPESEWIYKDWYFTHEEAFGGATTIPDALFNNPKTVLKNILMNLGLGIQMPAYFFAGKYLGPISILFWAFLFIGLLGLICQLKIYDHFPQIASISLGVATAFAVFTLTIFFIRYIATLLPIMLLILCHVAVGMSCIKLYLNKLILKFKSLHSSKNNSKAKRVLIFLGGVCVILGLITNEWFLASLILPYKDFSFGIRLQIWAFNISLVVLGSFIIFFQKKILNFVGKKIVKIKNKSEGYSLKKIRKITTLLVVISVILLLITAPFPLGKINQIKAVFNNEAFLSEAQPTRPVSMVSNYQEITSFLNKNTKVLALEHNWLQAYTEVKLNNIYEVWSLPPFIDRSGEVNKTLCGLDVILISSLWSTEAPNLGCQRYLRYLLHVKPFLENSECGKQFQKKEIKGYGAAYIKK
ncbi:MAG: hypothetical protein AABW48_03700 [Nanoarchaeota archaeon]|mgnify:CR=1 FL=1